MPKPQVLTPKSIEPTPITFGPQAVDWERLVKYPPFQNYVAEKVRDHPELSGITDSLHKAQRYVLVIDKEDRLAWMMEDYAAWHSDQGKWSGETIFGDLK